MEENTKDIAQEQKLVAGPQPPCVIGFRYYRASENAKVLQFLIRIDGGMMTSTNCLN